METIIPCVAARIVVPEILDHLPPGDPRAIRSRRDLRLINALMGNHRWLLRAARRFPDAAAKGITEIGAGDGLFTEKLAAAFPQAPVTALDLAPRPAGLAERINWRQGDIFRATEPIRGGILIANLFLHHFEGDLLRRLGELCDGFDVILFSEPLRARLPHFHGRLIQPFVNHVTRHDMHVSIDAGFTKGELPHLMGLCGSWQIKEHNTCFGALRVLGSRN